MATARIDNNGIRYTLTTVEWDRCRRVLDMMHSLGQLGLDHAKEAGDKLADAMDAIRASTRGEEVNE